jgi:hypothetical protein
MGSDVFTASIRGCSSPRRTALMCRRAAVNEGSWASGEGARLGLGCDHTKAIRCPGMERIADPDVALAPFERGEGVISYPRPNPHEKYSRSPAG